MVRRDIMLDMKKRKTHDIYLLSRWVDEYILNCSILVLML